ncbi:hypothetical protein E1264_17760 [Actinomadura sp. KC216]|uniref:hypothetical protein n=1 Tax=Actinomadura sp. KC216 TaxID=2530370 RepID=UPI0010477429|nr:hypothetical protein [Actinomadura sp. KC216]TDB86445.1 hypothetical protein E1264_17760 [Actinomadura sp. KC216]
MDLVLETKAQPDETVHAGPAMLTPAIDEDYWLYRVKLSERQAIVGFPKFGLIGIGFAVEEDWNTNLPSGCDAEQIYEHIAHNKGDDSISREDCLSAIRMIQDAVREAGA